MAIEMRILLLAPQSSANTNLLESMESLGYEVIDVVSREEALSQLEIVQPAIVLASSHMVDGDFCEFVRRESDAHAALLLVFPHGTRQVADRAFEIGADGGLPYPVPRDVFVGYLNLAAGIAEARRDAAHLRSRAQELGERLDRLGDTRPGQRFYHFEFFKHLLLLEIRRAKRYRLPLSVCLLELDPYRLPPGHLMARRELRAGVARAVSESIRDIDIPVYMGGERILVVLPHTPVEGAGKVARRVSRLIREAMIPVGDVVEMVTASIGVAGLPTTRNVSFARLYRDAQRALEVAQRDGGDRVVALG